MNLLLIPLGLIVKTDVNKSLQAFAGFFNALELGIEDTLPKEVLYSLNPLFNEFNLGNIDTDIFSASLLATIIKLVPEHKKDKIAKLEKEWPVVWKDLWNRQCSVEGKSIAVMLKIAAAAHGVGVVIFSETNPVNFEYISNQFAMHDVGFEELRSRDRLLISFEQRKTAAQMLDDYMKAHPFKAFRLAGNLADITNPLFYQLAVHKESAIVRALNYHTVTTINTAAHLSQEQIESALQETKFEAPVAHHAQIPMPQKRKYGD